MVSKVYLKRIRKYNLKKDMLDKYNKLSPNYQSKMG